MKTTQRSEIWGGVGSWGERLRRAVAAWRDASPRDRRRFFHPKHLDGVVTVSNSPSGRYRLVVEAFRTGEHSWNYTRGRVYNVTGSALSPEERAERMCPHFLQHEIYRNYSAFPFCWVTQGDHEFLLMSEDYQGYGVYDPAADRWVQYIPPSAKEGFGFCWARITHDATRPNVLTVEGCYWACPYEIVEYDISDVLHPPYPELSRRDAEPEEEDEETDDGGKEEWQK